MKIGKLTIGKHLNESTHSALNDVVSADFTPRNVCRVSLAEDSDRLSFDNEFSIFDFHGPFEASMDRVIFEHVGLIE